MSSPKRGSGESRLFPLMPFFVQNPSLRDRSTGFVTTGVPQIHLIRSRTITERTLTRRLSLYSEIVICLPFAETSRVQ